MEIFDVVDELGNPTGEFIERGKAHALGIRHRTAHIWVVRKKDNRIEFILQKRAENKDSFPGCYDTSSAGHIHAGDQPIDSAVREIGEELGISVNKEDLKFAGTFRIQYQSQFHGSLFKDNEIAFVYIYYYDSDIEKLQLQKEEVSEVQWFEMNYLDEVLHNHDSRFCVPINGFLIAKEWANKNLG